MAFRKHTQPAVVTAIPVSQRGERKKAPKTLP